MKHTVFCKLITVLLLGSLLLGLASCAKKKSPATDSGTVPVTTTAVRVPTTPEELLAASWQSRGVYEIIERTDFTDSTRWLSVTDGGLVWFLDDGRYAYHDLADAGYVVTSDEAYRFSGADYAAYSRLWRQRLLSTFSEADLTGAQTYTAQGETCVDAEDCSFRFRVEGTSVQLTYACFRGEGSDCVELIESDLTAPALPDTYQDGNASLPAMQTLLSLENSPFLLAGEMQIRSEEGQVNLSVLEGSYHDPAAERYEYIISLAGAEGEPMQLSLLCDGERSALMLGESVLTADKADAVRLLSLLLSYAETEELPRLSSVHSVAIPTEDGAVRLLTLVQGEEDAPALVAIPTSDGSLTFVAEDAPEGAGGLTVTPVASVPVVSVPTEAPVFVDIVAMATLGEALAGTALSSEDGSVVYTGALELGYAGYKLCSISYESLLSGVTGDGVTVFRIPYVPKVTDGGMSDLIPSNTLLVDGSTTTYLYQTQDMIYLKKVISATYIESLFSQKTVTSTACYKLPADELSANSEALIPWILNVNFDSFSTLEIGRAETLLAGQGRVYVGMSDDTVTVRADVAALAELYSGVSGTPAQLPDMLADAHLDLEALVVPALDVEDAPVALSDLTLKLTMSGGVYIALTAEPRPSTDAEVQGRIPADLADDPAYLPWGE